MPDSSLVPPPEGATSKPRFRRQFGVAFNIAVSAGIIGYLLHTHDVRGALARLESFDGYWGVLAVLAVVAVILGNALRLRLVVDVLGVRLPWVQAVNATWIGYFFNQLLPSSVGGDAMRGWRLYRYGLPGMLVVKCLILDRATGVLALGLLLLAAVPAIVSITGDSRIYYLAGCFAAGGLAGACVLLVADKIAPLTGRRFLEPFLTIAQPARVLWLSPGRAGAAFTISLINYVLASMVCYCLAAGIGLEVRMFDFIVLVPPVLLFSMLPISLAGWGLREGAMVTALGFVGVDAGAALLVSVLFGASFMFGSLPGAVLWSWAGRARGPAGWMKAPSASAGEPIP